MAGGSNALAILGFAIAVPAAGAMLFALSRRADAQAGGLMRLGYLIETVTKIATGEELSEEEVGFLDEAEFEVEVLRGIAGSIVAAAGAEFMYSAKQIPLHAAVEVTRDLMRQPAGGRALKVLRLLPAGGARARRLRRRTPAQPARPAAPSPRAGTAR